MCLCLLSELAFACSGNLFSYCPAHLPHQFCSSRIMACKQAGALVACVFLVDGHGLPCRSLSLHTTQGRLPPFWRLLVKATSDRLEGACFSFWRPARLCKDKENRIWGWQWKWEMARISLEGIVHMGMAAQQATLSSPVPLWYKTHLKNRQRRSIWPQTGH